MRQQSGRGKRGKIFESPDGERGDANHWGEKFGCGATAFRVRIRRWGLGDPRTWKPKSELATRKDRKTVHSGTYTSPCGTYSGTIDEIVENLRVTRACFIDKKNRLGLDDVRTWLDADQAEIYRKFRLFYARCNDTSRWKYLLVESLKKQGVKAGFKKGILVMEGKCTNR